MVWQTAENSILYSGKDGQVLGRLDFLQTAPGVYDIVHTEVDASLQGQGIAGQLVQKALEEIERRGAEVQADVSCSYAARWLARHGKNQSQI